MKESMTSNARIISQADNLVGNGREHASFIL